MLRKLKLAFWVVIGLVVLPPLLIAGYLLRRARRDQIIRRAVRLSPDGLQTATLTFEKPDQNQRIRLFGMIHVGQEEYYREILGQLEGDEQAGAQVVYERLKPLSEEEGKDLPPTDRQVLKAVLNMQMQTASFVELLGLRHQMDVLAPQDSWCNTDASLADFLTFIRERRLQNFVLKRFGELEGMARVRDDVLSTLFYFFVARSQVLVILFGLLFVWPKMRQLKEFILSHRNQVGVDGIMTALQTHNQVDSTWGAAHLPGMAELLAAQGFALTDIEWRTAFTFRKDSFLQVAQSLGRVKREQLRREFSLDPDGKDK